MGLVSGNPATSEHVRRPRQRPPTPRGLSADELRRLLAATPTEKPSGLRDRAIILTCIFTALRRQEVMRLRVGDLVEQAALIYRRGELVARHARGAGAQLIAELVPEVSVDLDEVFRAARIRPQEQAE